MEAVALGAGLGLLLALLLLAAALRRTAPRGSPAAPPRDEGEYEYRSLSPSVPCPPLSPAPRRRRGERPLRRQARGPPEDEAASSGAQGEAGTAQLHAPPTGCRPQGTAPPRRSPPPPPRRP